MWYSIYSVGDIDIDQEHANLDFLLSSLPHDAPEQLRPLLAQLIDATIQHFVNEENIARKRGYAMTEEHLATHRQLTQELRLLKQGLDASDASLDTIPEMLQDMLKTHILEYDRFLKGKES